MTKNWKYRLALVITLLVTTPYIYVWFFEHFSGSIRERLIGSLLLTVSFLLVVSFMLMLIKSVYEWIIKYK